MFYREVPASLPAAEGLIVHFSEGSLERRVAGGILLRLRPSHSYETLNTFQKVIVEFLELTAIAETISSAAGTPTLFKGEFQIEIPAGTAIPDTARLKARAIATYFAQACVSLRRCHFDAAFHHRMKGAHIGHGRMKLRQECP
jgi:hypothetical protein